MNCPHCGAPLEEAGKFCGRCGSELSEPSRPEPPPRPAPRPQSYGPPPPSGPATTKDPNTALLLELLPAFFAGIYYGSNDDVMLAGLADEGNTFCETPP